MLLFRFSASVLLVCSFVFVFFFPFIFANIKPNYDVCFISFLTKLKHFEMLCKPLPFFFQARALTFSTRQRASGPTLTFQRLETASVLPLPLSMGAGWCASRVVVRWVIK
jgi:hypothetical protein